MKPLSQRLEEAANAWPTVYESDRENIFLLREAAKLAKRHEDGQTGYVEINLGCVMNVRALSGQWMPNTMGRVRIILDNQENE